MKSPITGKVSSGQMAAPRIETILSETGDQIWVKRSGANKRKFGHFLQSFFTFFIPLKILTPTASKSKDQDLQQEAMRMEKFRAAGFVVPDIVKSEKDILITKHLGKIVPIFIHKKMPPEQKDWLLKTAQLLLRVHQSGLCHGRPHIKDMVVTEKGEIGLLDFEEDPVPVMGLARGQARDIFVFTMSITRFLSEADLFDVASFIYNESTTEVQAELARLIRFLKPVRYVVETLKIPGKDVRHAIAANKVFEKIIAA